MCNISKQTDLKEKIIYKVVYKDGQTYYSPYVGKELRIGPISPLTRDEMKRFMNMKGSFAYFFNADAFIKNYITGGSRLFNKKMVGKTSGFATLKAAKKVTKSIMSSRYIILKLNVAGEILKGTSKHMYGIRGDYITYAGTEILSMKEVK